MGKHKIMKCKVSKFNPFNTNENPELDRVETYKTFYKKRFRKL